MSGDLDESRTDLQLGRLNVYCNGVAGCSFVSRAMLMDLAGSRAGLQLEHINAFPKAAMATRNGLAQHDGTSRRERHQLLAASISYQSGKTGNSHWACQGEGHKSTRAPSPLKVRRLVA